MRNRKLTTEEIREKFLFLTNGDKSQAESLNESVNKTSKHSTLLKWKKLADGKLYGIVKESNNFYLKVCSTPNKQNINVTDFAYIGGLENMKNEKYTSFTKAEKRFQLKESVLKDNFGKDEDDVVNEEIPLNKDIDAKKETEPTVEPVNPEPVEQPVSDTSQPEVSNEPQDVDNTDITDYNPETGENTPQSEPEATPSVDNDTQSSEDSGDTVSEIQSLLGKLSNEFRTLGDIDAQLAKSSINNIISSTKSGIEKMDDNTKDELKKRIENNGEKLDEEVELTDDETNEPILDMKLEEIEKLMESRYGTWKVKKIIRESVEETLKDSIDEYKTDNIKESVTPLEIGKTYKTDSGMGGTFNVEYKGEKDGKHVFVNKTKDFDGNEYSVKSDALKSFIKEDTVCDESSIEKSKYQKYLDRKQK